MRVSQLLVAAAVAMAVWTGCRREGQGVSGSDGSGVLAGPVVLDGIEGSPAGVEVSARDTGLAMTLGADGRFGLASLAAGAQGQGWVTVELGRSGAARGT